MTTKANLVGSLSNIPVPQMVQHCMKELLCPQARNVCPLKDTFNITLHLRLKLFLPRWTVSEMIPYYVCPPISSYPAHRWHLVIICERMECFRNKFHLLTILPSQRLAHSWGSPGERGRASELRKTVWPDSTPVALGPSEPAFPR